MVLPSGDQSGWVSGASDLVTCTGSPPETDCTQMLKWPPRSEAYAMKRPSGEKVASVCSPSPNVIRVSARGMDGFAAAAGTVAVSAPARPRALQRSRPKTPAASTTTAAAAASLWRPSPVIRYSALDSRTGATVEDSVDGA